MRIVSFAHDERRSFGVLTDGGIVDAGRRLGDRYGTLRELLAAGAITELGPLAREPADFTAAQVRFLPVIADRAARIFCVGVNYMPHIREMGRGRPDYPVVFVRFTDSLVGHGGQMIRPVNSEQYDYEGELAVIIGARARHVSRADALDRVAGYSCFNDGSLRDFQNHGPQWIAGKNFPHSGAFGPWMVTADQIPDPGELRLTTRLNGEVMQSESVGELCFDVPALIEYISSWTALEPGDVICTGTPGGVGAGRNPPVWMRNGDAVEVEISGIGTLRNTIADEKVA